MTGTVEILPPSRVVPLAGEAVRVDVATPFSLLSRDTACPGETVAAIFARQRVSSSLPVICLRNGEPVLRENDGWSATVAPGDVLTFLILPQGGNTLRTVAGLAAVAASLIAAPYLAPYLVTATGGFLSAGVASSLIAGGLAVGSGVLINGLMTTRPAPTMQQLQQTGGSAAAASPTYSLSAQGNQARLLSPIPRLYGTHLLYPDFAAQPWARFVGNEQYLYQLFCLGVGEYDVQSVRMGDLLVWSAADGDTRQITDIEIEFYEPGETVDLFRTNVFSSAEVNGQELRNFGISMTATFTSNEMVMTSPTPTVDVNLSGIRTGDRFDLSDGENTGSYLASLIREGLDTIVVADGVFSYQGSSAVVAELDHTVGPFVVCPSGKTVDTIEVDFVFPGGLYYHEDDNTLSSQTVDITVESRLIDDDGNPVDGEEFETLGDHSYSGSRRTALRFTEQYAMGAGRYEVRARRTNSKSLNQRSQTEVRWVGLKGFVPDDDTYSDVSLMAIKMRATDLTAQSTRTFNVIETGKVPVWDGDDWTDPAATDSIAWAIADMLRNSVYGAGLSDSQFDRAKLIDLHRTWVLRGDTFNGIYDTSRTLWDAVSACAAAGRAQPLIAGGLVTFVRDEPRRLAVGSFTPRNIKRGSLSVEHVLYDEENPIDDVIVEFKNAAKLYKDDEIQCSLPGSSSANPARINMFGVTDRDQAEREGLYRAAANKYGRIVAQFNTDMEGKLLLRGDPILVSVDFMGWGQSGDVVEELPGMILRLSQDLEWPDSGGSYIALSKKDNTVWGPCLVTRGAADSEVVIDPTDHGRVVLNDGDYSSFLLESATEQHATRFHFSTDTEMARRFRVAKINPRKSDDIVISGVLEDDRVYDADGAYNPSIPPQRSLDFSKSRNSAFVALF